MGWGVCVSVCVQSVFVYFERTNSCDYRGCQVQSLVRQADASLPEGCCRISRVGEAVFALLRLSIYLDEVH